MKRNSAKPLVSIVMPVFNGGRFLSEAIESILNQTYKDIELVVVDDKSTDNSWQIIEDYQHRYPQVVKAIKLRKNRNSAGNGAVNAVFKQLKGKYFARMDADDIAFSERIEKQVAFLENHPEVILLGTQGKIIDGNGNIVGNKNFPCLGEEIYREYFVFHPILHPSVMIRKSAILSKTKLYENKMGVNDDYYTFFKLLQFGKFANLPDYLLYYRIHGSNLSLQEPKKKFINSLKIRLAAVRQFNYRPTFRGLTIMVIQSLVIFAIPERLIVPLFFLVRKVSNPIEKINKVFAGVGNKEFASISQ